MALHLIISLCTEQCHLCLVDSSTEQIIAHVEWQESDGRSQGELIQSKFQNLLDLAALPAQEIETIFCVQGPGSFTSLRIAGSFAMGLKSALNVPLFGIATYDLMDAPFYLSLRPRKTSTMNLEGCLKEEIKFLLIQKNRQHQIQVPTEKELPVIGLKDSEKFPSLNQLVHAHQKSLKNPHSFEIDYGYEPQFVKKN